LFIKYFNIFNNLYFYVFMYLFFKYIHSPFLNSTWRHFLISYF